jgi:hypothetical protein
MMLPSTPASLTPVTVAVCGTFQFALVKVTLAGLTVPSVVSLELKPMVTSAVGWVLSTTVNVAVPPTSVVDRPEVGLTVMPAVSLSVATETSLASTLPTAGARGGAVMISTRCRRRQGIVDAGDDGLGTFQLTLVKIRLDGLTVPSVVPELSPIVTSAAAAMSTPR